MNIEPLGWSVVIRPEDVETQTESGIIIAVANERLERAGKDVGTIVAIGPLAWKHPKLGGEKWADVGDLVYYTKYGGRFITDKDTGIEYIILADEDVKARFKVDGE